MKLKGFLYNTLAIVLIISFILIDSLIASSVLFENKEENQRLCVSINDESIDEGIILQNTEV